MRNEWSIPVVYDGIEYRSRTEARWAVLFNAADLAFQYEPEGYKLPSGWYVPDFWIESWAAYFEVKPENCCIGPGYYSPERSKCEDLASFTRRVAYAACGWPSPHGELFRFNPDAIMPDPLRVLDAFDERDIRKAQKHGFGWRMPNRAK